MGRIGLFDTGLELQERYGLRHRQPGPGTGARGRALAILRDSFDEWKLYILHPRLREFHQYGLAAGQVDPGDAAIRYDLETAGRIE